MILAIRLWAFLKLIRVFSFWIDMLKIYNCLFCYLDHRYRSIITEQEGLSRLACTLSSWRNRGKTSVALGCLSAESPASFGVVKHRFKKVSRGKIRPEFLGKIKLAVTDLPKESGRGPMRLPAGSNYEINWRQVFGIKTRLEKLRGKFLLLG